MVPRVGDGYPSFPVHSYLFQKDEAFIWRGVHSREAFNWSNTVNWTETRSTRSEKKLNIMDSIPNNMGTADSGVGRPNGPGRYPGGTTYHRTVGCMETQGAPPTTGLLVVWRPRGHHLPQDCWLYWDPGGTTYHRTVGCIETQGAPPTTGLLVVLIPRGHHLLQDCWLYWDPGGTTYHRTVGCIEIQGAPPTTGLLVVLYHDGRSFIKDHPPGSIWSLFTTFRIRNFYYHPDPPQVTFYMHLHQEAGTFGTGN